MRDRNNPLKHLLPDAFTIIMASREIFRRDLADLPVRYPKMRIAYLSGLIGVPYLILKEQYQENLDFHMVETFERLIAIVRSDRSALLFIGHSPALFGYDHTDRAALFGEVCRERAKKSGPVVLLATNPDPILSALKETADYFIEFGGIRLNGVRLAIKEQTTLESLPVTSGINGDERLFGQMKLEW